MDSIGGVEKKRSDPANPINQAEPKICTYNL